jgi:MFS family permease
MLAGQKYRLGVSSMFLVHGLVVATWLSRIPAIQAKLALSPARLGSVLLASTVGAMIAMPLTGWLVHHTGSRVMTMVGTTLFCASLPLMSLAPTTWWLAAALFAYGAAAGCMDVAMNAQAVMVEHLRGRPVMSSFHGLFSLGAMGGALIGGLAARTGQGPYVHFTVSAIALGLLAVASFPLLMPDPQHQGDGHLGFRFTRRLAALGLMGFCILLGEGAMADWSAVYLRSSLGTGPGLAAVGYAIFSGGMTIGRFVGDHLTGRLGRVPLVRKGALLASAGLSFALIGGTTWSALIGFAAAGLGFAAIVPLIFAAAGKTPGMTPSAGIASVTTAGWLGFLTGPPLIGFTAEWTSLRTALAVVAALSLVGAWLAPVVEPTIEAEVKCATV